jgi:hypothetical protein
MRTSWVARAAVGGLALAAAAAAMLSAPAASIAATSCPSPPPVVYPFLPWNDPTAYVLTTGGAFEKTGTNWSMSGSAKIVSDQEPWKVNAPTDANALGLPSGSSATSGPTCAPQILPVVRFFAKSVGTATGQLHVEVLVNGGMSGTLDAGTITPGTSWEPTAKLVPLLFSPLSGTLVLQVRLTPVGVGAAFVVDDVYLDPYDSV